MHFPRGKSMVWLGLLLALGLPAGAWAGSNVVTVPPDGQAWLPGELAARGPERRRRGSRSGSTSSRPDESEEAALKALAA